MTTYRFDDVDIDGDLTVDGSVALNGALTTKLQTNGQVEFPATQNPSSGANTLDDYEENTWTPTLTINGGTTGITYAVQVGHYTKIGRFVHLNGRIVLTSKGALTGLVALTGMPFTPIEAFAVHVGYYQGMSGAGALAGYGVNAAVLNLTYAAAAAIVDVADTNITNTFGMYFCATYRV